MIPVEGQDPLIPHPAQLRGHSAPVHGKEIRELLPVKRNIEGRTSGSLGLFRQVGQQLFSRRPLRHMLQFLSQHLIFQGKSGEQIADQTPVELAGGRTYGKDTLHIEKQYLTRLHRNGIIQYLVTSETGIHFTKYLSLRDIAEDTQIPPVVLFLNVDAAF